MMRVTQCLRFLSRRSPTHRILNFLGWCKAVWTARATGVRLNSRKQFSPSYVTLVGKPSLTRRFEHWKTRLTHYRRVTHRLPRLEKSPSFPSCGRITGYTEVTLLLDRLAG